MTLDDLVAHARQCEGLTLQTVTGKAFSVGVYRDTPFFTPQSTGRGQSDGPKAARAFVERYNESGSLAPGTYSDVTRNASYFVALVEHLLQERQPDSSPS